MNIIHNVPYHRTPESQRVERINNLCKERRMSYYALSYESAVPMTTLMHIVDKTTVNPGVLTIGKLCDGLLIIKQYHILIYDN